MLSTYNHTGPLGYRPLREFLTRKLKSHADIDCAADEILITSGSTQGLALVNSLLVGKGDTILVEQETYGSAISRLVKIGVNAIGIPLDDEGLRLDALKQKLEELKQKGIKPKYIYTIPTMQNPTGAIMGEARRAALLKLAAEHGVMIFEDECYSDLVWTNKRPPSLYAMAKGEGVIFIGSFSKSIGPALRVGYIVAKWDVLSRLQALKQDAGSGAIEQMMLAEYCSKHFADHVHEKQHAVGQQDAGPARGAGRAVRHRRRVRRSAGRHLSLDQAARQRRYGEACPGGAGGRRVDQPRAGMVGEPEPIRAIASGSASPIPSPKPSSRAWPCWPRSAAASSACRCAAPTSTSVRAHLLISSPVSGEDTEGASRKHGVS